jgi:hypothetical protein
VVLELSGRMFYLAKDTACMYGSAARVDSRFIFWKD